VARPGGITKASLRRIAHYDYWSDTVRPSMLVSSKADLLVFGMGERPILEIARRLAAGETVRDLRDMRGVCYLLGRAETAPEGTIVLPDFDTLAPARSTRSGPSSPANSFRCFPSNSSPTAAGGEGEE
jgi:radical SAM superfamily enzyme YgiQ (UPF0313 family)